MKKFCLLFLFLFSQPQIAFGSPIEKDDEKWRKIISLGINKSVNFHAWGGSSNINKYIVWVGKKLKENYNIKLNHVKIQDTSQAVKKVLYDKIAKKNKDGSIDLIWINGENFSAMLKNDLLHKKNWIYDLPNTQNINLEKNSSLMFDFGIFNEGREMPWGLSQLIYFYNHSKVKTPPKNANEFKNYILNNPGRITFPKPPDFTGTSFLKQVLLELTNNNKVLREKFDRNKHNQILKKLWDWLDQVTPYLWKSGKNYPKNYLALSQLLADDEVDIGMSFNISFPNNEVLNGNLPKTTKSYISEKGSISNTHYLAIPYNSKNINASKLAVNFLISPEAQLQKQKAKIWGDPNILTLDKLDIKWQKEFKKLSEGPARIKAIDLQKKLPEPHPSWMEEIERIWIKDYGSIN